MWRALLNLSTALSVLLLVAASAAWVRSYDRGDYFEWSVVRWGDQWVDLRQRAVQWDRGRVLLNSGLLRYGRASLTSRRAAANPPGHRVKWKRQRLGVTDGSGWDTRWGRRNFLVGWYEYEHGGFTRLVGVPCWLPVALAAVLPGVGLLRLRRAWVRRRRAKRGRCVRCGYDLRASKDTCPECGAKMVANPSRGAGTDSRPAEARAEARVERVPTPSGTDPVRHPPLS